MYSSSKKIFLDKIMLVSANSIPLREIPTNVDETPQMYNGKKCIRVLVKAKLSVEERVIITIYCLVITIFSAGIALFFTAVREKWKEVYSGFKYTPIYTTVENENPTASPPKETKKEDGKQPIPPIPSTPQVNQSYIDSMLETPENNAPQEFNQFLQTPKVPKPVPNTTSRFQIPLTVYKKVFPAKIKQPLPSESPLTKISAEKRKLNEVLMYVKINGLDLKLAPEFSNHFDVVLAAVTKTGLALEFASAELQRNPIIVNAAVKQNGLALEFVKGHLRKEPSVLLNALESTGLALQFFPKDLIDREIYVKKAVSKDGKALKYASEKWHDDDVMGLLAVEQGSNGFEFLSNRLKKIKKFVLAAAKHTQNEMFYFELLFNENEFANDDDVVNAFTERFPENLSWVNSRWLKDENFIKKIVAISGEAVKDADESLRKNLSIALIAVNQNGKALEFLPFFQDNIDVVTAALKNTKSAYHFVHKNLANNPTILALAGQE